MRSAVCSALAVVGVVCAWALPGWAQISFDASSTTGGAIRPGFATTCNAASLGAIRTNAGVPERCNGASWVALGSGGGGGTSDQIVSGTDVVTVNGNSDTVSFTLAGTTVAYLHPTMGFVGPGISTTANRASFTTIYASGNVGIGTTAPAAMLTVNGGVQVSTTTVGCSAATVGTIRVSGSFLSFCDGSAWYNLKRYRPINIQYFNVSGTWTRPAGATRVDVWAIGGGGGGAAAGGVTWAGGGPGRSATWSSDSFNMDATESYPVKGYNLPSTVTVTVGLGGAGEPQMAGGVRSTGGTAGGDSSFGSFVVSAGGSSGAGTNGASQGTYTVPTGPCLTQPTHADSLACVQAISFCISRTPSDGAGGCLTGSGHGATGRDDFDLGLGGTPGTGGTTGTAGGNGVAPPAQPSWPVTGGGGGGGGRSSSAGVKGGDGGNGAFPGGGGGGGGAGGSAAAAGARGGNGANGQVIVVTYF